MQKTDQAVTQAVQKTNQAVTQAVQKTDQAVARVVAKTDQAVAQTTLKTDQAVQTVVAKTEAAVSQAIKEIECARKSVETAAAKLDDAANAHAEAAQRLAVTHTQTTIQSTITPEEEMPRVAIFPASTPTGLETIKALTSAPHRRSCRSIVCVVRNKSSVQRVHRALGRSVTDYVEFAFADITDEASMETALSGIDRVFIIPPGLERRGEYAANAAATAAKVGVAQIIMLSVLGAPSEATMFACQFRFAEKTIEKLQTPWTFLRSVAFMDNLIGSTSSIMEENGAFYGSQGEGKFAPIANEDVGRMAAAVLAVEKSSTIHHGKAYNLTGPELLTGKEQAEVLARVLKKKVEYVDVTSEVMSQTYLSYGMQQWQADGMVELFGLYKSGMAAMVANDVAQVTGAPQVTLERFVMAKRHVFKGKRPLVCVFPANGRVGTAVLEALMLDSHTALVRAVVKSEERKREILSRFAGDSRLQVSVEVQALDGDESKLLGLFQDVDSLVVIPLPNLDHDEFVSSAIRVAHQAGVIHTILFSVGQHYIKSTSVGKRFQPWEEVLKGHASSWTIVGSTMFMQMLPAHISSQFREKMNTNHKVHHAFGFGACPFIDLGDVGKALAAIVRDGSIKHYEKQYFLTGQESVTFAQIGDAMSSMYGVQVMMIPDLTLERLRDELVTDGGVSPHVVQFAMDLIDFIAKGNDSFVTSDVIELIGPCKRIGAFLEESQHLFS